MNYSPELKDALLRRMLPPNNESITKISREEGISEQTLRNWRDKARRRGYAAPGTDAVPDNWSTQDKFLVVVETATMNETELAEYARKKGLYVEQIKVWKDACVNANGGIAKEASRLNRELKDSEKERRKLEKELQRKEKALAEAAALLVLSKKANAIWGGFKGRMISASDRENAVLLIDEAMKSGASCKKACERLGITDKILPIVKEWQERPLEEVYAVVFMDAIHYPVRSEGRIVKRAVYIALGINMNGKKDVLGMYVGENESAKFWLSIMNGLKNRGVSDILIACVDGLNGFPQAIEAVYPNTEIQQCIIHQIRNATKFVSYKDIKKLMSDLKRVYAAPTEEIALNELELFKDKWDSKYPKIYKSWHDNWATLSTYFKYPEAVRRLIYTTNAIEGFNRQLRKVTKSKTVFPSDDSLLKMLYLATMDITKKWTGHRQDWGQIHSQLEIYFEERLAGRNL